MRPIGIIANCLYCDSYFMLTVDHVDLREIKGKNDLEAKLEKIQLKYTIHKRYLYSSCPTCSELCYGVKYQDFYHSDKECTLSLCKIVMFIDEKDIKLHYKTKKIKTDIYNSMELFDENPIKKIKESTIQEEKIEDGIPVYIDMSDEGQKPKWTLNLGLGPQKIELDTSKSGRIYQPFLKQFGLNGVPYQKKEKVSLEDYSYMNQLIFERLKNTKIEDSQNVINQLEVNKPIYDKWNKVENLLKF